MAQQSIKVRQEVRALIKKRGWRKYNVWTGFASKGGGTFALDGTARTMHLIWMEADREVQSYSLPSSRMDESDSDMALDTIPDAICLLRSGIYEWRQVKEDNDLIGAQCEELYSNIVRNSVPNGYNIQWRTITPSDLAKHTILIKNWRRGLAYLWAATEFDLRPYAYDIRSILRGQKTISLKQLLDAYPSEKEPLLVAALFDMSQKLELETDLGEKPFGFDTVLWMS